VKRLAAARALQRELVTPEGIALPFELAGAGERLVAFLLDLMLIFVLLLAISFASVVLPRAWRLSTLILASFGLTQFYFAWCELRGQGATPGKRRCELRVIDRRGGRLSAVAIFSRNVTRLVEVQLPLVLLLNPGAIRGTLPTWMTLVLGGWVIALGAFPLLNRDRLRIGDLVAGTLVVHVPRAILLPDLSQLIQRRARPGTVDPGEWSFTPEQLSIYGIYELQVLEELLRSDRPDRREALETVAAKVQAKIGWESASDVDAARFLAAFYAAQRARLEQELLFGKRKARKSA
jgi:uncharacterized RDD family membrane protein YckC